MASMAYRSGFFLVRGLPKAELPEALLATASHAPADTVYERFMLEEEAGWSAAMSVDGFDYAHRWAQAVAFERRTVAISFFIIEGTWSSAIFDAGEHVHEMKFFPYGRPLMHGDMNRASALLGCSAEVFVRYHEAILAACDAGDDFDAVYPRAYEDDEFEAADEYGYMDFARRIGIPSEIPFGLETFEIRADTPRPDRWVGLPALSGIYQE